MSKRRLTITPHIHWHEGMMLTPQHFQQMEFRHHQHLSHQLHLLSNHHWGVHIFHIDPIALNDGRIRILEIEAVMPDGLIVNYRSDMTNVPPLELDISGFTPDTAYEELTIFLSMPERLAERSPTTGELARFISIEGDPIKDENLPDNVVEIPRLFPHLILSVGAKPPPMCQGFPVLKIIFDETYVQTSFVPPCFYITHDTNLWRECAELAQRIREKAMYLSERWQNQVGTPLVTETEMMLRPLIAALPALETILHAPTTSPYVLFQKICDIAGHLAALRLNQLPPVLQGYNHNDIQGSFAPLLELLHQYLNSIEQSYAVMAFQQRERLFYLKFHKNYLTKTFLVGIRASKGMTESQTEEWLMDAVICSDFAIDLVRNHRITGAKRKLVDHGNVSDLMPGRGMIVAEITLDSEFIAPEQNLNIFNPSDLPDRRPTEIVAPLLQCFEVFYYEILRLKERALAYTEGDLQNAEAASTKQVTVEQIEIIQTRLKIVFEEQSGLYTKKTGGGNPGLFQDAQYIMVALADEVFLNLTWAGAKEWRYSLLEGQIFQTQIAGELFFKKIDSLFDMHDVSRYEIGQLYLMALSLGFRGKYRDHDPQNRVKWYQEQLYQMCCEDNNHLFNTNPNSLLFDECYEHILKESPGRGLPDLRTWAIYGFCVFLVYMFVSYVVWYRIAFEMHRDLHTIFEQTSTKLPENVQKNMNQDRRVYDR
eukprot:gene20326-26385_t